ncbi:hypothetical protein ACFPZ0_18675 [Streptomonospora nanhaiensis]|uniref:Uncharacterized protein n=1 Tax=Streptomonospora nanhaiensis TaxID=1323731 RepID=A0A853BJF2_9ACTN|nr:hypothetical protein [Streptomonospora nanhaiensis]MBV2364663.1 hypothetical protein [Streptomonospora nanhaiensis]MBX9390138.1 hypothetical protein [Streptomonospora nanhaiensis]NYI94646.1 hypothetical protein [Streptomonospora nanhaiensis]
MPVAGIGPVGRHEPAQAVLRAKRRANVPGQRPDGRYPPDRGFWPRAGGSPAY